MILWMLRVSASAMLLAGVSVLFASAISLGTLATSPGAKTAGRILLTAGAVLAIGGGSALYFSRARGRLLPNERTESSSADKSAIGGWLILLAIVLVALPGWTIVRLMPFLEEWRNAFDALDRANILQGAGSNMGGIVLIPLAAALTPPFVELMTLVGFVVGSALLLVSLLARSPRFPRAYLVWIVLMLSLVIVSVMGAYAVTLAGQAVEKLIEESRPRGDEAAQLREVLRRYTTAVTSTAPVLVWTLCGYLIWAPLMVASPRVRTTFANPRVVAGPTRPDDLATITRPDRFPGY